jgi:hypothetical protein
VRDIPVPAQHLTARRRRLTREPVGARDAGRTVAALVAGTLRGRGSQPQPSQAQTGGHRHRGRKLRDSVDDRSPSSGAARVASPMRSSTGRGVSYRSQV